MSDADLVREGRLREPARWSGQLEKARFTSERVGGALPEHVPRIHAAQSQRIHPVAGPGWIAAGDAAMTFDPLSSQGIVKALRSGKLASYVAFDHLQGRAPSHERYERIAQYEYETYDRARRQFYSMEQRWPESPFWLRRR
jgi:flavin-dependent dehydrogenase